MLLVVDVALLCASLWLCWSVVEPYTLFEPAPTFPPREPSATQRRLAPGAEHVARTLNALALLIPCLLLQSVAFSCMSPLCYSGVATIVKDVIIGMLSGTAIWYCLLVIFGADVLENYRATLMLALLIAALNAAPIVPLLGWKRRDWHMQLFASQPVPAYTPVSSKLDSVDRGTLIHYAHVVPAMGTALGLWLGALPLPLDWDRVWQDWPITCVIGALVGRVLGTAVGLCLIIRLILYPHAKNA